MNDSKISVRYSKALFLSAKQQNKLDVIRKDLALIADTLQDNVEVRDFLDSPTVKPSGKLNFVQKLFSPYVDELTLSFLKLVNKNKRESALRDVVRCFERLYFEYQGVKKATLTTAVEIDELSNIKVQKLLEKLFDSKIELSNNIDNEIIGGFVLRVDDSQINASVKADLQKILHEIS